MEPERDQIVRPKGPAVQSSPDYPGSSAESGIRYDFEIDLESDSTHANVVRLVGRDRRVLELGPAAGYMSRVLRDRGCTVVGIELDPQMAGLAAQFCERVIVGDLDTIDLESELGSDRFDVIVAADVLEHLKNPLAALRRLRAFLAQDGFFVMSLPNVAHGSVRLALLEGRFNYQKSGLLDETHLRFFTRESIDQLLDEAELGAAEITHQQLSISASEVPFDSSGVPREVIEELERDPDARTYQFVVKAIPLEAAGLREMQRRMRELAHENARLRSIEADLRSLEPQISTLQDALTAMSTREGRVRAALIEAHELALQRDEEIHQLRHELLPLRKAVDRARATPLGRAYVKLRRLRRLASTLMQRLARLETSLRKP